MTLKDCIEIWDSCGFSTIEKCYDNVVHLSTMMFKYEDINKEILELQKDIFYNYPDLFCQMFDMDKDVLIKNGWKVRDEHKFC